MTATERIKQKLIELGASPNKALGQNFLINERTVKLIIAAVQAQRSVQGPVQESAQLIEIGPGLGALTEPLMALGRPLTVIEYDGKFSEMWRQRLGSEEFRGEDFQVIEADALKLDWAQVLNRPTVLVSNLPYQISSSLVIELSPLETHLHAMILMFQKEVAQRITALPASKDYGLLSVIAQVYWQTRLVVEAGPGDFYPPPKISSRVLAFTRRPRAEIGSGPEFLHFVKAAFAQRRKLLQKNLARIGVHFPHWQEDANQIGFGKLARAEELSPQQFVELYLKSQGVSLSNVD